tara:strand:- start:743 stop:1366 length:624 start_codon:yes stop_codon:yes gene_type:complete
MEQRKTLCVQISRGIAPAVAIASTVGACTRHGIDYHLITGKSAADAKNEAAKMAYESGRHLVLCEDDFLAESELWARFAKDHSNTFATSALMRNGQINVLYHGDRLVLSGTVCLKVPWEHLELIGSPWFSAHNLSFDEGEWTDNGPNIGGFHSDTWFFYRCWTCGIIPEVAGFVTHLIHAANNKLSALNNPDDIKPLGMMSCSKLEG